MGIMSVILKYRSIYRLKASKQKPHLSILYDQIDDNVTVLQTNCLFSSLPTKYFHPLINITVLGKFLHA